MDRWCWTCRVTTTTRWDRRPRIFYPVGYSFGLGYKDECTTLNITYSSATSQPAIYSTFAGGPIILNPSTRNQTVMIQLGCDARRRQDERRPLIG